MELCAFRAYLLTLLMCVTCSVAQNNSSSLPGTFQPPVVDCWLTAHTGFREKLAVYLSEGVKLIEISVTLEGHPSDMLDGVLTNVYKPYRWVRSTSRQGRSLLMLDENYSYMSLSTLSIGVENMHVNLTDHPIRCLRGRNQEETLRIFRESFLRDFQQPVSTTKGSLSIDEHICNVQIIPDDGYANFQYRCCHTSPNGDIVCQDMLQDQWIKLLLAMILIIKILVVLFSPSFLPESIYRLKYVAAQYVYHLPGKPMTLKAVVTQCPDNFGEANKHKTVRLSRLKNMEYFKTMVSTWTPEKIYEVKVKDVRLSVKARKLLDQNTVPVTMWKLIYNGLIRCRIRRLGPLEACCNTNILGKFNPGIKNILNWYQCMKIFAGFCLAVIIAIPWIIRVSTYFNYEADMIRSKEAAADKAGLEFGYPGNITLYLTPVHGLFIIIYFIFIVDSVVYGVISKAMKEKFKYVLRQCLRDMRERSRINVLSWMTGLIVLPFKVFGILGIILFIPYLFLLLIVTLPIVVFYVFPTVNLSVRLIIHLFIFMCPKRVTTKFRNFSDKMANLKERLKLHEVTGNETFIKKQQYTTKGIVLQMIVVTMCLISFWSITLLLMEVCSFFVEVFVYTFMGIIVNAGVTLQYVTVFFLLFLYSKSVFSKVHLLYQAYHKVLHNELMAMKRQEINAVAMKEALDQENTAFTVFGDSASNKPKSTLPQIKVKAHEPQWATKGMLIFLDRQDTPYTPEKFFQETIDLNYFGCPGPIYKNLTAAIWEFLKIILFLLFVFVVVMAFGDAYSVSTTNQLLATVVGGFVPFLFRYIFKSSSGVSELDTTSIQFKTEFHRAINDYSQAWNVFDIINPLDVREWDGLTDRASMDGNGKTEDNGNNNDSSMDPNSSTAPLLDTSMTSGVDSEMVPRSSSMVSIDDDTADVDIIVDVSNSETRSVNALLTRGFEKGSVTMLDKSHKRGSSARIYKSPEERSVDVV